MFQSTVNFLKNSVNFLRNSAKRIIFSVFLVVLFSFLVKQSFSKDEISTTQIIDQIEKVLSEPKGSVILKRKPEINIDRATKKGEEVDSNEKGKVSIELIEKRDDKANRLKEKLAYNATISGQYEASLELYKQILASEKNNSYAKFGLATSYHKLKQFKQAKEIYYDLLSEEVDNKDEIIGNILEILVEDSPSDANYLLTRLASQSPNSDYILARAALTYDRLNQKDEAILLLKRAIAIRPENPQYYLNLAVILDKNNESQEALKYYKAVVQSYVNSNGNNSQEIDFASVKQRINFIENNS